MFNDTPVFIMTLNAQEVFFRSIMNRPDSDYLKKKYSNRPILKELYKDAMKEEDYYYFCNLFKRPLTKKSYHSIKDKRRMYPATALTDSMDSLYLKRLISDSHIYSVRISDDSYSFINTVVVMDFSRDVNIDAEILEKSGETIPNISLKEIRHYLYENGFDMKCLTRDGAEKTFHFVEYKRSAAAAKEGKHLFMVKELASQMLRWTWLGLDSYKSILDNQNITHAKAYEALVSSNIHDFIELSKNEILLIDDVHHAFFSDAKVVRYKDDRIAIENNSEYVVNTNLFDGQSLLDASFFERFTINENTSPAGMLLLRNHFFKTAAFSTNIQKFFEDYYIDENGQMIPFITDMFGRTLRTQDIKLITTPSSLKILKLANSLTTLMRDSVKENNSKKHIFEYWLDYIDPDSSIAKHPNNMFRKKFGVVKTESVSSLGEGKYVRMSYQMLNSLPLSPNDINEIISRDKRYLDLLYTNTRDSDVSREVFDIAAYSLKALAFIKLKYQKSWSIEDKREFIQAYTKRNTGLEYSLSAIDSKIQHLVATDLRSRGKKNYEYYGYTLSVLDDICKTINSLRNISGKFQKQLITTSDIDVLFQILTENIESVYDNLLLTSSELEFRYEGKISVLEHHIGQHKQSAPSRLVTELLQNSTDFLRTPLFKSYKTQVISDYKTALYQGRIKVPGDYYVLCSMPMEMLLSSIHKFHGTVTRVKDRYGNTHTFPLLKNYEVFNKQLFTNKETQAVIFRNPHITASNVVTVTSKDISYYVDEYFGLSDHIIIVSPWENDLLSKLGGADFDSDTVLCTTDRTILKAAEKIKDFPPVYDKLLEDVIAQTQINHSDSDAYPNLQGSSVGKMSINHILSDIDHQLSNNRIGEIVNLSQLYNSYFWNCCDFEGPFLYEKLIDSTLYESILICSVLATIEIDKAKHDEFRMINMGKVIDTLRYNVLSEKYEGCHVDKNDISHMVIPGFMKYIMPRTYNKAKEKDAELDLGLIEAGEKIKCPMNFLDDALRSLRFPQEPDKSGISLDQFFSIDIKEMHSEEWSEKYKSILELAIKYRLVLLNNFDEGKADLDVFDMDLSDEASYELMIKNYYEEDMIQLARELKAFEFAEDDIKKMILLTDSVPQWKKNKILVLSILYMAYQKDMRNIIRTCGDIKRNPLRRKNTDETEIQHNENQLLFDNITVYLWDIGYEWDISYK